MRPWARVPPSSSAPFGPLEAPEARAPLSGADVSARRPAKRGGESGSGPVRAAPGTVAPPEHFQAGGGAGGQRHTGREPVLERRRSGPRGALVPAEREAKPAGPMG